MPTREELLELVPKHKHDLDRVRAIQQLGWPAVEPILPELLEWLQDINWPVARDLAPFLIGIGEPLAPHVRRILDTDDHSWKYWLVNYVVKKSGELTLALREDLRTLASAASLDEDGRELAESAAEILELHRLS